MGIVWQIKKSLNSLILLIFIFHAIPAFPGEKSTGMLEHSLKSGPALSDLIAYAYETSPMIRSVGQHGLNHWKNTGLIQPIQILKFF